MAVHPSINQKGQVLLVIVLVMIVALTIGLSVVTRSVTNLQISTEEENSQRALSAAEAGIERALSTNQGGTNLPLQNNAKIDKITVSNLSGREFLINNGNQVLKDDVADMWLAPNDTTPKFQTPYDGNITIYWGSTADICANGASNTMAALEIVLVTRKTDGAFQVQTYPLESCNTAPVNRHLQNHFCSPSQGSSGCPQFQKQSAVVGGKNFVNQATLTNISDGILVRIIPLYASTTLAVTSSNPLPSQGRIIESVGSSGNTQRKISVYQGYDEIPVEFFPYTIFSP